MFSSRTRSYLMLLAVAMIWGAAGPVIKYTLSDFPPFIFLAYRFWLTTLAALPFLLLVKKEGRPETRRDWMMVAIFGLFSSTVNLGLLFLGFDRTTALDGTLLSATSPLLVVIAGAIFLNEQVTGKERLGLAIAFLGTILTVIQPLIEGKALAWENVGGNLLIMAANLTWVVAVIISKIELKHRVSPFFLASSSFILGFFTMTPIVFITSGFKLRMIADVIFEASITSHLGVWYMAIISGLIAYTLYQKGQKEIEASEATLFGYLNPIFAAPLAVFWLGEEITLPFLLGAGVIALGVGISEWKGSKKTE